MPDPLTISSLRPVGAAAPVAPRSPAGKPPGDDFAAALRRQLEQVNQMQTDAEQNVQQILSGGTQNITEVFTAARKAQVAFSLLMEIRNKLVDAWDELRNLRV
jgi:flagellar hook-basal body complex protein FliE